MIELRVHGVGGAPGARQLGLRHADDVVVVRDDVETRVLARRTDPAIRSYEWGGLTSGSPLHALWILLLPFTLLNVAGWMHPREKDQAFGLHNRLLRILVASLGLLLTATFTLWVVDIVVGLVAYQWAGNAADPDADAAAARHATTLGFAAVIAILTALAFLARRTQTTAREPHRVASVGPPAPPAPDEPLSSPTFFDRRRPWYGGLAPHVGVVAVVLALAALRVIGRLAEGARPPTIGLEPLFLAVTLASVVGLVVLAVATWLVPFVLYRRGRTAGDEQVPGAGHATGRAAGAVALAFVVASVYGGGASLWLATVLGRRGPDGELVPLVLGGQTALTDALAATLVAWVLVGLGLALWWWSRTRYDAAADEDVPERWRKRTARAQALARIARKGDAVGLWLAAIAVVVNGAVLLLRIGVDGAPLLPWRWHLDPPAIGQWPHRLAAWTLPALIGLFALQLRDAGSATRVGRALGQVWDVLTFWPRAFHPLAVRPYAQRVVPELRAHIEEAAADGGVVVSAHSQGSVLAFAALAPLGHERLARVALVSYGSPLGSIHARAFPAYFNRSDVESLRSRLLDGTDGWHNFWRFTDPVGGPVLVDGHDTCLPDPGAVAALPPAASPGIEPDRQPGVALAVHSLYLREPLLKATVDALKGRPAPATDQPPAGAGPPPDA